MTELYKGFIATRGPIRTAADLKADDPIVTFKDKTWDEITALRRSYPGCECTIEQTHGERKERGSFKPAREASERQERARGFVEARDKRIAKEKDVSTADYGDLVNEMAKEKP